MSEENKQDATSAIHKAWIEITVDTSIPEDEQTVGIELTFDPILSKSCKMIQYPAAVIAMEMINRFQMHRNS